MEEKKSKSILVKNISSEASEKDIFTFFAYCGRIDSVSFRKSWNEPGDAPEDCPQEAVIVFEQPSAVDTAVFLNAAYIQGRAIQVIKLIEDVSSEAPKSVNINTGVVHETQAGPTKSSVIANLIANGYVLATDTKQKAKEFDDKRGWSDSIKNKATQIDNQYHIADKAATVKQSVSDKSKELDAKYNISGAWSSLTSAVGAAVGTATSKVMENQTVAKGVHAVKEKTQEIKEDSQRAIEEKQKEKEAKKPLPEATTEATNAGTH